MKGTLTNTTTVDSSFLKKNSTSIFGILILAISFVFFSNEVFADEKPLERIIAVIGSDIILLTDLDNELKIMQQRDPSVSLTDPVTRDKVLQLLINEKLLQSKAVEDSIVISEDEVKQRLDYHFEMLASQYGSKKRLEDIYGMSIERMKKEFKEDMKKQLLSERLRQTVMEGVKCSSVEVEEFYNSFKDSLPDLPTQFELFHIVKYIQPSEDSKKDAVSFLLSVRDSILAGGDFGEFAKKYSQDPGSGKEGGDLGFFERGKLMPEYEKASFALERGQMSQPVETPFGLHLIKLVDKTKDAVHTKHILFKVGQTERDIQRIRDTLVMLKNRVVNGANFQELAKLYSEEKETKNFGGSIGKQDITRFPPTLVDVISNLKEGEVSDPQSYSPDPTKNGWHILYLQKIYTKHKPNLKDDYQGIELLANQFKQNKAYEDFITKLRAELFWEKK